MQRPTYHVQPKRLATLARLISAITAILVLIGGVTYASLQSQQIKLTGNTIQTTTANLQISPDGASYATSQTGFTFSNIVPGGQAMPQTGYTFYLKNSGGTPLALTLSIPTLIANTDNIDLDKVHVILTPKSGGQSQDFTLSSLTTDVNPNGVSITSPSLLPAGASQQYSLQVSMDADAVSGTSATLSNIDFAFRGTAIGN